MSDLRALIREVLADEISALKADLASQSPSVCERVDLVDDKALNLFARRVAELAADPQKRTDILSGRHLFAFQAKAQPVHFNPAPQQPPAPAPLQPTPAQPAPNIRHACAKTLITERYIGQLSPDVRVITLSAKARLTPLAQDEIRRLNIKIERTST